jgi:SAM-dependent methyltransferase
MSTDGPSIPPPGSRPDHIGLNRAAWDQWADEYVEPGRSNWSIDEPTWGIFGVPESQLRVLPPDLHGKDTLELGCGTGYVSSWLARRGARPVGLDLSARQLDSAARFQREFGVRFPLIQANAEIVPLRDASFDLVISEYGAAIWSDPYRWIPEAARLLRPGGDLAFLGNGAILLLCEPDFESEGPAGERLLRDYFGMHRYEWPDNPSVEFHLGSSDWIRLLRASGFEVLDLIEVRPPEDATTRYELVTLEWARRWPCEEIWKARKVR